MRRLVRQDQRGLRWQGYSGGSCGASVSGPSGGSTSIPLKFKAVCKLIVAAVRYRDSLMAVLII